MKFSSCPLLMLVLLTLGCRTTAPALPEAPLPFHLALAPIETLDAELPLVEAREASYRIDSPEPGSKKAGSTKAGDERFALHLGSKEVTDSLATQLERGFARLTVLTAPESADFARLDDLERARYWQERARAVGADLWVQPSIQYEPVIEHKRNEKFWFNLPLFLLGGPLCYFVGDNTYHARVKLNADFYAVTAEEDDPLADGVLRIPLQVEFEGTDLGFTDRAEGVGDYLLSLLVPAGFLARESDKAIERVRAQAISTVSKAFLREIYGNERFFSRSDELAQVELAHAKASVRRHGTQVSVVLPVSARTYIIEADATLAPQEVPARSDADGYQWIRRTVALPVDAHYLRLRLLDNRSELRSYTLRIEDEPAAVSGH